MKNDPAICRAPTARPHTSPEQRSGFARPRNSALKGRPTPPIKAPSRQKPLQSCLIKANQGKRQIRESSCWMGRTGVRMPNRVPRKNPLLGERKQVRESVPLTCLTTSPCRHPPIKAKTPVIVPHQGKSRQIKANARFANPVAGWVEPAYECQTVYQGKILFLGRGNR